MVQAGFDVTDEIDVTDHFRITGDAFASALAELESELRGEEGDEIVEESLTNRRRMQSGIAEGLLLRSLLVAVKN
jgi:hypothetical protein